MGFSSGRSSRFRREQALQGRKWMLVRRVRLYFNHQSREFFEVVDTLDRPEIGPIVPPGFVLIGKAQSSFELVVMRKLRWLRWKAKHTPQSKNMLDKGVDMDKLGEPVVEYE